AETPTYRGILYIGIMDTIQGMKCLEFNVRAGNPEWIVLLKLLGSPLIEILDSLVDGKLHTVSGSIRLHAEQEALLVMTCSEGYPLREGLASVLISGLSELSDTVDF